MRTCFSNIWLKSSAAAVKQRCCVAMVSIVLLCTARAQEAPPSKNTLSTAELSLEPASIWEHGMGEGFRPDAQSLTISAGANYGIAALGGKEQHHLAVISLTYGHMLGRTLYANMRFQLGNE